MTTPSSPGITCAAHALIDLGRLEEAEAFIAETGRLAAARAQPSLTARLAARAGGSLRPAGCGRRDSGFARAREALEPLGAPYELGIVELSHGQLLRRDGKRRLAAAVLESARARLAGLGALPVLTRCERELAACGLAPSARSGRDYTRLTPQETAVARLVVSGLAIARWPTSSCSAPRRSSST